MPYRLAVTLATLIILPQLSAISVWINEIHYDNSGGDVGEFVEIAGVAGINLTGYSVTLYTGSNGTVYDTINLSGVISDESNGFGALAFFESGIQNGAPDGLAFADDTNNLLQFLSYEGAFVGVGGPANGISSTDIGVSESSSTATGQSLQLTGFGSAYSAFNWSGPSAESPGTLNTIQSFPQPTSSVPGTSVPDGGASSVLLTLALSGLLLLRRMV